MGSIVVKNLGKAFKNYPRKWSRLTEWINPFGKTKHQLQWVLQDINFIINPGEAVGIIGLNGAGKSTLLKIITGTSQPTTGSVETRGRVAALLELGIGFHPDFSGRQNVLMAGQLLGYSKNEILDLMPGILEFAEIGEYIDKPVRVYSSGMQVRLAFSVATARRPDLLIIDEALSVGDAYFQHKSFQRIREYQKLGSTLLIVSHDKQAIQSICSKALLLKNGRIVMEGKPEAVMDYYNAMLAENQGGNIVQSKPTDFINRTSSGTGEASITDIGVVDTKNNPITIAYVSQEISVLITVTVGVEIEKLVLGCGIKDRLGQMIFGTNTYYTKQVLYNLKAGQIYLYKVSFLTNLGVGTYSVHASLVKNYSHIEKNYHWVDGGYIFEVVNKDKPEFVGCSWNDMKFEISQIY